LIYFSGAQGLSTVRQVVIWREGKKGKRGKGKEGTTTMVLWKIRVVGVIKKSLCSGLY